MRLAVIASVFLLFTLSVYAADIDGKWSGTIAGPQGEIPLSFTFKADGATLTGTTLGLDGAEIPIKDGKINGKDFSFTVTFDFGGMPLAIAYQGVQQTPEELKIAGDFAGMPFEFTLKKAK